MPPWLTVRQTAEYLQLSEAKVYSLVRAKKLPAAKIGSQWRVDREAVDRSLRSQARNDAQEP